MVAGSGNPNYRYQKEASAEEEKAAQLRIALLKEQIAGQAIGMYAQFVLSDLSLKLAKDAVLRATQLLENQKKRESFGLVEKADRYQTEALLAARKLQLAQAKAEKRAAQTALNRLMYQEANTPLVVKFNSPKIQLQSVSQMLAKAESKRPVFQVLAAQYKAAEAQLSLAQTSDDYQLDLIGQVGTRALDGNAGTAFTKGFNPVHDRYIGISVEFSDVLDNKSSHAAVQKGVLALEGINIERRKALMDLQTEIATLLNDLHSAKITLKASKAQVKAEKKKYQAEMERYQKGRTPTSAVIQFEGDLRAAQLREAIQRVSLGLTEYKLALAVGELPELLGQTQGDVQ